MATNGGCPFSPLGVNVETVRTIFTIVPPAAPTSSTCFLTHNVISRVSAWCTRVYEASSAKFYLVNVGGTTWRTDPDTNLRPLFGHSPLFCLLDAHCDALFLFALKTVHRRSRSRTQGNIESHSWIEFSFHFEAVLQNFSLFDPRSVTKMIFCM